MSAYLPAHAHTNIRDLQGTCMLMCIRSRTYIYMSVFKKIQNITKTYVPNIYRNIQTICFLCVDNRKTIHRQLVSLTRCSVALFTFVHNSVAAELRCYCVYR